MENSREVVFLYSYFKGTGDGLHLALSRDGFNWKALNNDEPYITPAIGPERLMRDPFILPAADGMFHLVWTAGWHGKGIGYASSPDLLKWSAQRWLGVMEHEAEARNCWAPEIFFDDSSGEYIIYWASTIPGRFPETDHTGDDNLNHRMYCVTTKDFESFSDTRIFFDGGFNVIDGTLVKNEGKYLLFVKDETLNPCQKNIRLAVSSKIFGGFDTISPPLTGAYWAEGPSAIRIDGRWIVFFDKYKLNRIGAVSSEDLLHWEDISDKVHFPAGAQHGSAVKIPLHRIEHLL